MLGQTCVLSRYGCSLIRRNPLQIKRPMLAATLCIINDVLSYKKGSTWLPYDSSLIPFPLLCTPKIDGIRCLIVNGQPLSRSFKLIPNKYIQNSLKQLPDGFDGELIVPGQFHDTSSAIMSFDGKPNFTYMIFDWLGKNNKPYKDRVIQLQHQVLSNNRPSFVQFLLPTIVHNIKQLEQYEKAMCNAGHEGTMLRTPYGPYKFGRSTLKEFDLVKLIRRLESEAKVVGFEELYHNNNEQKLDNFGNKKRSSHQDGMIPMGTLGALCMQDVYTKVNFKIGTGMTAKQRQDIWNNRKKMLHTIWTYQYKPFGVKDKPRGAVLKAQRRDI